MNEMPVMHESEGIVLFHPHVPERAIEEVTKVLHSRWIGQGPRVAQFEKEFTQRFAGPGASIAVCSGTDALHLAYMLAGLKAGDEVIVPVFTCTATNVSFLYMGVNVRFADVDPETLNINVNHVRELINEKTKAIVCVHYGGLPCDMDELQAIAKHVFSCWEEHGGGSVTFLQKFLAEKYNVFQALISDISWISDGVHAGKGAVISLRDSLVPRRSFVNKIIHLAKKHNIPHQLEVEGSGGSDAKELQMSEHPWDWCFVGAGEQNVHTPDEKVHKKDIESMLSLYKMLMKEL